MMESATTLMTGHVNVGGFFKVTSGLAAPLVSDYPQVLELVSAGAEPRLRHGARGRGWAKAVSEPSDGPRPRRRGRRERAHLPRVLRIDEGDLEDLASPARCSSSRGRRSGSR